MQIGSLMAHLCWKNYEISRKFGKIILRGLNNVKLSLLRPYLAYMESYLTIKDEYQTQRLEWLLGIPDWNLLNNKLGSYTKVGMSHIKYIDDAVITYLSPLPKKKSNVKESVL